MADEGVLGNGVKVAFSLTSPVSWTSLGQLLDVTIPGLEPDKVEVTTHGSVFKRFMRGLLTVSDLELQILQDLDETTTEGAKQDQLYDLQAAGTTVWWRIEVPVDRAKTKYKAFEYQGNIQAWKPSAPIADKQVLSVTVAFDGDSFTPYAAGASAIS